MIIYFADRAMNILGSASTGLPKGLMITDDKKTEEISEGVATFECNLDYDFVNSDEEQEVDVKKLAAVGNFILKQSADSSEVEVYTIIDSTIDPIQKDASIYAEDAGLDLLNEVVGKYAADKAYNIAYYINKFAYDSGFEIGINEVSNLTRKLSWDGETTATERLLSVATQFDNAEIEFSFKVENMAVTGKYINVYKNRGNDSGVTLTVGKEVSGFRIKSSIADLATAYRCTGGTPEGSENPITLNGYKYDDGDFYVEGSYVKSRKALKKWSRYQIKTEKNKNDVGHIVKSFTYDTTSKSELCNRAVSSLKKICDEAVTYEVELLYLPDGVKVGDTVSIVDDDDNTYLTARLLKLETSESNDTKEAELGDYARQESGIDEKVIELAERFEKIAKNRNFYTWTAFADDENGTGISANAYGKDYLGIATNRLTKEADLSDPTQYTWVKIKGEQGIPGTAGKDGKTTYFHIKYSPVENPTSSQMSEIPNTYIGTYVDYTEQDSTDPSKYTWYRFQGLQGAQGIQGIPGTNGADGKTSYLHIKYSNDGGKTFTSNSGETVGDYIGQCTDFNKDDPTMVGAYTWSKIKGEDGADGATGNGIKSTVITYQAHSSGTEVPTGAWSSTIPATSALKPFLWSRTVTAYTDGTSATTYTVGSTPDSIAVGGRNLLKNTSESWSIYWQPGSGTNICKNITTMTIPNECVKGDLFTTTIEIEWTGFESSGGEFRLWSQGAQDDNWNHYNPFTSYLFSINTESGHAIYSHTVAWDGDATKYDIGMRCDHSSGAGKIRWRRLKIEKGNKATDWTPAPEDSIKTVVVEYYLSTSATSLSGGSWSTTAPTWINGKYMWSRTVITDGNGNKTYSPSENGVCIAGAKGDDGKDGQMLYATCDTAAGTVAKVASLAAGSLSLKAGATVAVKFTYANTASSPTLNIAGTGAKAMYIQGVRDVYWTDGATVTFTYDGINWRVASEPVYAPTATIGNAAGFNVFIDGTSVQVRKGTEELASFKGDEIRLGEGVDCAKVFICNLEIGVDSEEMYLRNASTRISTKASHEGGSSLVPSVVVDDKDTWINGRGMSSLIDFYPRNVHRMTAGTKVLTAGKTGTSRQLFSNSEINSLLGVSNSSNGNTAIAVSNGDGAATGVHVEGCTYQNGAWNAVFNTNIGSVPIRINYIITYWG